MRASTSRAVLALILAGGLAGALSAEAATAQPDAAASQPANLVRPEFAKPFNEAQTLIKANKAAEALAKLKECEAVGNLTPYEQYLVTRVRAPAEFAAGDLNAATHDFEAVLDSPLLPAADRLPIMKALIEISYNARQYDVASTWMKRFVDAGGNDPQISDLLAQTLYLTKDYAGAAKAYKTQVDAAYAAGHVPPEKTLRLLASSQAQTSDDAAYVQTLEHLAVAYPKPDYWKELIGRATQGDAKVSDRLYVDTYRLKATALGDVADSERLSYAALAFRSGFPAEAKRELDAGMERKAFTGADAGEAAKLQTQVNRAAAQDKAQAATNETSARSAKDGNALVSLGLLDTMDGDAAHGQALIEQGIAKGGLKAPEEARLHLGIAQYRAGHAADAVATFQSLGSTGPVGTLAHVWTLLAQSQVQAQATPAAGAASGAAQ